ncbi:MAG: HAD-IIIA family hydrolase, partial [Thermoplasmata archaeon]|nr:HAD-IIIA family hydrolase [Thermoplasmata archaeon]
MSDKDRFAVFVDRDGTICFDKHYLASPGGLEIVPGVVEGLKKLNAAGMPVIIVTNQSGVGRGLFSKETLDRIHARLGEMLASRG